VGPRLALVVPDRIRKRDLIEIIDELINDATGGWCRRIRLCGVCEVKMKVVCTISDQTLEPKVNLVPSSNVTVNLKDAIKFSKVVDF
jgi:hypothetical protein